MKEKLIEIYLKQEVEKRGGMCVKFAPIFFAGFPDRLVFMPRGFFRLVELKADGKRLSPIQKAVFKKLGAIGFEVIVISSVKEVDSFMIFYDVIYD